MEIVELEDLYNVNHHVQFIYDGHLFLIYPQYIENNHWIVFQEEDQFITIVRDFKQLSNVSRYKKTLKEMLTSINKKDITY